jgi:transcription initiation factor TFIIB
MSSAPSLGDWQALLSQLKADDVRAGVTLEDGGACPKCRLPDARIVHLGQDYCRACGTWCGQAIDASAEWRVMTGSEEPGHKDRCRCGLPITELMPGVTLGSVIGYQDHMDPSMRLARKYQVWGAMTYRDRVMCSVFDTLTLKAAAARIPVAILDDAKCLYRRVADAMMSRGMQRHAVIASSIYVCCKQHGVPRSTREIASVFDVPLNEMTRAYKRVRDLMDIRAQSTSAEDLIRRFCSKLGLDNDLQEAAMTVNARLPDLDLLPHNTPPAVAAACIHLCTTCVVSQRVTRAQVAEACFVSAPTVHKCFKLLYQERGRLLPHDFIVRHRVT